LNTDDRSYELMSSEQKNSVRDERKRQLLDMWRERDGQQKVLRLCHRALPAGEELREGMSAIDIILEQEFGADPAVEHSTPPRATPLPNSADESPVGRSQIGA
jgi:hypothetical protein